MNTPKERLIEYLKLKHISKAKFQRSVGVSGSYVNNMVDSFGAEVVEKIRKEFPDLNVQWLLYGEGEMLMSPSNTNINGNIFENSQNNGSITQVNNHGDSDCDDVKGLYKDILALQKEVMGLKNKALKARLASTQEEKDRLLDEILMSE